MMQFFLLFEKNLIICLSSKNSTRDATHFLPFPFKSCFQIAGYKIQYAVNQVPCKYATDVSLSNYHQMWQIS
jgi:hypothetical protein